MCKLNNGVASPKTAECTCDTYTVSHDLDCCGNYMDEYHEFACDNCKKALFISMIDRGASVADAEEFLSYPDSGYKFTSNATDGIQKAMDYVEYDKSMEDDLPF